MADQRAGTVQGARGLRACQRAAAGSRVAVADARRSIGARGRRSGTRAVGGRSTDRGGSTGHEAYRGDEAGTRDGGCS